MYDLAHRTGVYMTHSLPGMYFNGEFNFIKEDKIIALPKKEAQIIKYFLQNKNKIIDIDELVINIWEYDNGPSIATIRTYLKNIRKIVGPEHFTTIKGIGYRFNQ